MPWCMDPQVATRWNWRREPMWRWWVSAFCAPDSTLLAGGDTLTAAEVEELRAAGVVGDIALQFFDREGRKAGHPIHERIVGTPLETIKGIRRVIGVAGGTEKLTVIRAALRGGLINVLVTDDQTAAQLLDPSGTDGN